MGQLYPGQSTIRLAIWSKGLERCQNLARVKAAVALGNQPVIRCLSAFRAFPIAKASGIRDRQLSKLVAGWPFTEPGLGHSP